jgi:hypothetical protein
MMHAPSRHEILLAEQRLIQSRRELAAGKARLRTAFRATLAKPGTLLGAAGAGAIAGYLLFRRPAAQAEVEDARNWLSRWPALSERWQALRAHLPNVSVGGPSTTTTAATAAGATSLAGIILAFATRYAMQRLPGIGLRLVEDAIRKQRTGRASAYPSGTSLH